MHGMYMGPALLQGRTGKTPKAYFTKEAHYSVQILRDLLGLQGIEVQTTADAAMDPEDLQRKLSANRHHPAFVVATIGTTFNNEGYRALAMAWIFLWQNHDLMWFVCLINFPIFG
jgi:histidine decarboxylase